MTQDLQGSGKKRESAGGHQTQVLHLPQPYFLNLTLVEPGTAQSQTAVLNSETLARARRAQTKGVSACKPGGSREWGQLRRDKVGVRLGAALSPSSAYRLILPTK